MLTLWDLIDPLLNTISRHAKPAARQNSGGNAARGQNPGGNAGASHTKAQVPTITPQIPGTYAVANHTKPQLVPQSQLNLSPPPAPPTRPSSKPRKRPVKSKDSEAADASMQAKYDAVVEKMLAQYQIRVRKWRSNMSGVAWYVIYRDGRRVNLIESPKPKGPMSAAIFLHEIGHHAIGFNVYKPRCLEEFHAWRWSLEAMEAHGLNITDAVRLRMHRSLHYAIGKASRRGIKKIPAELEPFLVKPPARRRRRG